MSLDCNQVPGIRSQPHNVIPCPHRDTRHQLNIVYKVFPYNRAGQECVLHFGRVAVSPNVQCVQASIGYVYYEACEGREEPSVLSLGVFVR